MLKRLHDPRPSPPHSQAAPAIAIRSLDHSFGSKQILFDIRLDVAPGEIVLLMGPSGCGKTTILTLVGGLRQVQSGSVKTLGRELVGAGEADLIATRRRIGFIYQSHNLHGSLTALENVRMGLEVHGPDRLLNWRQEAEAALASVGLLDWADAYPAKLSGGQKQRVSIARALVARPPLILADEPTAALDRQNGRQVVDLLRRLAKQRQSAVLMVTHDNRILDIGDRVIEMDDGRIAAIDAPARPAH
ncbi:ATP-binding cassette domain-containing protein [Bosea thiooxidans]